MMKEPEIKLFGRKILLPENGGDVAGGEFSGESSDGSNNGSGGGVDCDQCSEVKQEEKQDQADDEDQETGEMSETTEQDEERKPEKSNTTTLSESDNNPKTPSIDEDDDVASPNQNEQQTDNAPQNGQQQQKTLKKPDKILPCPRCNSMDTKFCYYNNYNVNQPRHFCKSCQRYWTAGGTMRNVPVGAGRRKNKNTGSHCRHITISEALQAARIDPSPNGFNHMKFKPNGTVLSFGPDSSPLCESMSSALNLAEKRGPESRNGFYKIENGGSVSCKNGSENIGCGLTPVIQNAQNGLPSPVPCVPGVPWSFPWNPAVPVPAIYPMPYYPTPYAWNMPWLTVPFPSPNQKTIGSNPSSPLGKHSRNGELITPNRSEDQEELKNSESSIVVPKTLRIDDPEEAAKSSIWATLGIKYGSISREGLFKALQPKAEEKKKMVHTSPLLQANPAALSRSISFQERA